MLGIFSAAEIKSMAYNISLSFLSTLCDTEKVAGFVPTRMDRE